MLAKAIEKYLAVRRAGGFKLVDDERYLYRFAQFAQAQGETHVMAKSAITWAGQSSSEPQRAYRLQVIIRFARFSQAEDHRHEIPPEGVFCAQRRRPTPYLFTETEVQALMVQATELGPVNSLRPYTYCTLIGLLAATGLRISEALGLHFQDLTADGLVIRETKFRKSRRVPLHTTTYTALQCYWAQRNQLAAADSHIFISHRGQPLTHRTVDRTFQQLVTAAGLPRPGQRQPRLVDFRHSFASNALLTCGEDRDHIGSHTLALMTYLGHAHPRSTFWYLERSPQLMSDVARRCERFVEEAAS